MTKAKKKREDFLEFLEQVERVRAEKECRERVLRQYRVNNLRERLHVWSVNWVWRLMGMGAR